MSEHLKEDNAPVDGFNYVVGALRLPPASILTSDGLYRADVLGLDITSDVMSAISRYDIMGFEEGRMSPEELERLRELVEPIVNNLTVSKFTHLRDTSPRPPWSRRNQIAARRLPNSDTRYSRVRTRPVFRGPGRYSGTD